jgi:hypothetical protein
MGENHQSTGEQRRKMRRKVDIRYILGYKRAKHTTDRGKSGNNTMPDNQ